MSHANFYSKRSKPSVIFTLVGIGVLSLTSLEIAIGREEFLALLSGASAPLWVVLVLALSALNVIAASFAFIQDERDWFLICLGVVAILYTIFAVDNIFYFFKPLVIPNDAVEVISILYSAACITAGVRWAVFIEQFSITQPLRSRLNRHRVAAILFAIAIVTTAWIGPLPHVVYRVPLASIATVALWRQSKLAFLWAVIAAVVWLLVTFLILPFLLSEPPLEVAWAWLYWGGPAALIVIAIVLLASRGGRKERHERL